MVTWRQLLHVTILGCLAGSCGTGGTAPGSTEPVETLVREFTATPINAGVHPDAFAYRLDATVMKGENPCIAENSELRLNRRRDDDTLYITALRRPIDPQRVCTLEHDPVFEEVSTEIRGYRHDPAMVIVENVGEMGQERPLW